MKRVEVKIKGRSPLLMHRFGEDERTRIQEGGQIAGPVTPETKAEAAAYRLPSNGKPGNLYIPATNLWRALVSAASYEKGRGRATLAKVAAAALSVTPEALDLGTSQYVIDSRPVVIPSTKGRVMGHRPRLDEWQVSLFCDYDETLISEQQLRNIFDHCGSKVGVLDFRPEKKGPMGRFMVIAWKTVDGN
jgi:hypothetical protein